MHFILPAYIQNSFLLKNVNCSGFDHILFFFMTIEDEVCSITVYELHMHDVQRKRSGL